MDTMHAKPKAATSQHELCVSRINHPTLRTKCACAGCPTSSHRKEAQGTVTVDQTRATISGRDWQGLQDLPQRSCSYLHKEAKAGEHQTDPEPEPIIIRYMMPNPPNYYGAKK